METSALELFGGSRGWNDDDWTASDDRVRGGKSQSYLKCGTQEATFCGTLDIKTLGGAGFASQRTTGEDREWNLSAYDGIQLDISKSDDRQYTFILKDELLPKSPNGRDQSTISYEYDFKIKAAAATSAKQTVFVAWDQLQPTYRGREKKDAPPLDLQHIKRLSLMNRSFFGTQEGPFSLTVTAIKAIKVSSESNATGASFRKLGSDTDTMSLTSGGDRDSIFSAKVRAQTQVQEQEQKSEKTHRQMHSQAWLASLFGLCGLGGRK